MKSYQKNVHRFYKPSSMWQKHIDSDFAFMKKSLEENNIDNFLFFLQNFGNWDTCLGIEHQLLIKNYSKNPLLKKFLSNELFQGQREVWSYYNQKKREFSNLNFPRIGNQNGAEVENNFLVYGSFFSSTSLLIPIFMTWVIYPLWTYDNQYSSKFAVFIS